MHKQLSNDDKRVLANRYKVDKKLGSGNFGVAYLVADLKYNEELKVLKEVSVGDMQPDDTVESVHEANLLSKLNHPYIVQYHDSFLDGEYFCIITEYCEGGDLDVRFKKLKKENKRLSEKQVLDWFVQLLSAVNYMHSRRVLHRDLKARNIFLKNEIIKIGDFGISRILIGTMDMASTFTGTPYYMSPEVLKHEGYNSKSDVWSLGCLLYEMCTLEHAFEGQGLMGVMYKIVEGKIPDLPNTYSRELNNILKKIFRKNPAVRPSTSELLQEPYITEHIKDMIERLTNGVTLNDAESTIVAKNASADIAKSLNTKYYVKDLKPSNMLSTSPPNKNTSINEDDEEEQEEEMHSFVANVTTPRTVQSIGGNKTLKQLTPKERLLLNKLKKADEEAKKVGQMAKENYEERMIRDSFRREITLNSVPNMRALGLPGYSTMEHQYFNMPKPQVPYNAHAYQTKTIYQANPPNNQINTFREESSSDEDDYEGTLLKTMQNYKLDDSFHSHVGASPANKSMTGLTQTLTAGSKTLRDDRPIQPMKAKIELNSFDDDGIPTDPHLTNEYYKNFTDEFEDEDRSPDRSARYSDRSTQFRNSLSKTVLQPAQRKGIISKPNNKMLPPLTLNKSKTELKLQSKTISGNNPRGSRASRAEYEQLINVMQNALTNKTDATETFGDDSFNSVFGTYARDTKIQNLRAQAVRLLGNETFEKCYDYLKNERSSRHNPDESKILDGLKKLTTNTRDCFLIDQLIFLEDQAK